MLVPRVSLAHACIVLLGKPHKLMQICQGPILGRPSSIALQHRQHQSWRTLLSDVAGGLEVGLDTVAASSSPDGLVGLLGGELLWLLWLLGRAAAFSAASAFCLTEWPVSWMCS